MHEDGKEALSLFEKQKQSLGEIFKHFQITRGGGSRVTSGNKDIVNKNSKIGTLRLSCESNSVEFALILDEGYKTAGLLDFLKISLPLLFHDYSDDRISQIGERGLIIPFPLTQMSEELIIQLLDKIVAFFNQDNLNLAQKTTTEIIEAIKNQVDDLEHEKKIAQILKRVWDTINDSCDDLITKLDPRISSLAQRTESRALRLALNRVLKNEQWQQEPSVVENLLSRTVELLLTRDAEGQLQFVRLGKNITISEKLARIHQDSDLKESSGALFVLGYESDEKFGTGFSGAAIGPHMLLADQAEVVLVIKPEVLQRTYFVDSDVGAASGKYNWGSDIEEDKMDFRGGLLIKAIHMLSPTSSGYKDEKVSQLVQHGNYAEAIILPDLEVQAEIAHDEIESVVALSPHKKAVQILKNYYPDSTDKLREPKVLLTKELLMVV